jgi:hypothetical protein
MYRRFGKNGCDALKQDKTPNLREIIPYVTENVMSARQEPGAGGGEQIEAVTPQGKAQTPKLFILVFHPLADKDASETKKRKN